MNIEDDAIIKMEPGRNRENRARGEEKLLERIVDANMADRDRCEAGFMVIDGRSSADIDHFIAEMESGQ